MLTRFKTRRKIALLFIIASITYACGEDDSCCTTIDVTFDIAITDEDGTDLLNPATQSGVNIDQVMVYDKIEGEWVAKRRSANSDGEYFIYQMEDDTYRFRTFANLDELYELKSYIQWTPDLADTFTCELNRSKNGSTILLDKLWFNGEEVSGEDGFLVELVK